MSALAGKTYGIGFAIALPDNWNNRFLFQGGGGLNGSVRPPVGGAADTRKMGTGAAETKRSGCRSAAARPALSRHPGTSTKNRHGGLDNVVSPAIPAIYFQF